MPTRAKLFTEKERERQTKRKLDKETIIRVGISLVREDDIKHIEQW